MKKYEQGGVKITEFTSASGHLDDDFVDLLMREARFKSRISEFLEILRESTNPPLKRIFSEAAFGLEDFIRQEWVGKGFKPSDIDHEMLVRFDPELVSEIVRHQSEIGALPDDIKFPNKGIREPVTP